MELLMAIFIGAFVLIVCCTIAISACVAVGWILVKLGSAAVKWVTR